MDSILRKVRHLLFGWANREFLRFLFFLAVAGIFWLLTTLNENFEQEVRVPLRFVNMPQGVVITSGDEDTLRVTVRDRGISLITYLYKKGQRPVDIDFRRYSLGQGQGTVSGSELLRLVNALLPASAKAVSVKPENEVFYYNNGESYTVPVEFQGTVEPDMPYFLSDITCVPERVTIYPSSATADSIMKVYTEPLVYTSFRDSLVVKARLQKMEGVKMVPGEVELHFQTDLLTEVTIDNIPVTGINMPEGLKLRTFPAKLSVSFVTGMKNYQGIQPGDFLIVADYKEFSADTAAKCYVYLRRQPADIHRVKLSTQQVDYLIEEHLP